MRSIWATLAIVSFVSVLVIDCTATGRSPPIVSHPMRTSHVGRRLNVVKSISCVVFDKDSTNLTIFVSVEILDNDIKFVAGVGEARARLDWGLGIRTVGDLLAHYPFRYIDRTRIYRIAEITDTAGLTCVQFRARVLGSPTPGPVANAGLRFRFRTLRVGRTHLVSGGSSGSRKIEVGREYLVFGRPNFFRGELSIAHPELETVEQALSRKAESGMQGIYPRPRN